LHFQIKKPENKEEEMIEMILFHSGNPA